MARRLRSATLCRASLRYGGERISGCGEKRSAEGNSQIGWSMALYLRGKISVCRGAVWPADDPVGCPDRLEARSRSASSAGHWP